MRSGVFIFAACIAVAVAMTGCNAPAPAAPATPAPAKEAPKPAPAQPKPATPAPPKPAPKPEAPKPAPPKPAPAPVAYVPNGPNFLYNASFEVWGADGTAASWNIGEGEGKDWAPVTVKKVAPAPSSGSSSVEIPASTDGQMVIVSQTVLPGKIKPEQRLLVSARAKAKTPEILHMVLTYKAGDKVETVRRVCQGGGDWSTMDTQFFVPKDADPASFRIQFILRKEAKEAIQLDDVRLQHMVPRGSQSAAPKPPVPAPAAAPAPTTDAAKVVAPQPASAAKPEAAKPEAAATEAAKPEETKPEAVQPEAAKPEAAKAETTTGKTKSSTKSKTEKKK